MAIPTIVDLVDQIQPQQNSFARSDRSDDDRISDIKRIGFALQDGRLNSSFIRKYVHRVTREDVINDMWEAKERAYGVGSTDPREVAEVYGWGGWQHQQAELSHKERTHLFASKDLPPPPIEDPEYLRDLLRRYNIDGVTIKDDPNVSYATEEEQKREGHNVAIAWAEEGSHYSPYVRMDPSQIKNFTREEIEDALAHEFIHTIMNNGTLHGPAFMAYADQRNVGSSAPPPVINRLGSTGIKDRNAPGDIPGKGRVAVHGARFGLSGNLDDWYHTRYRLLAEPGENSARTSGDIMDRGRAHILPGSAVLREWPDDITSPPYWEIGTVEDDGTIGWDCLTYEEPSQALLDEYVRLGQCPPELRRGMIIPTPEQQSDLGTAIMDAQYEEKSWRGLNSYAKWRDRNIKRVLDDDTLTYDERIELIHNISDFISEAENYKQPAGRKETQNLIEKRDALVSSRSNEMIAAIRQIQQQDGDDMPRPGNPERSIIAGSPPGLPYKASPRIEFTSPPSSNVSAWPLDTRMERLKEDLGVYQDDRSMDHDDIAMRSMVQDSGPVSTLMESRRRRTRSGRGHIRY